MNKIRLQGYISRENDRALKKYIAAHPRKSKSSVIDAALSEFFSNTTEADVLYRRLDRQQRAIGKLGRDLEILQEAFAVFVRLWFAHTPRVGEGERESAQTYAQQRYAQFCDYVGRQVAQGHQFVDDIAYDMPGAETGTGGPGEDGEQ